MLFCFYILANFLLKSRPFELRFLTFFDAEQRRFLLTREKKKILS
ncbi:hypothetical protein PORCRE_381 [Porphyromonas crevioricanis JCM 15906]|uniref:Uncharacterized protein n=1 Tax=Porphyromonas crevioricanis JCM 15906 TaxID=1305617 RepID=S4PGG1_9PORP|nr:hypothetical protein PORCRE_381 [Porphyromonas crevioricanis JCM 15906]